MKSKIISILILISSIAIKAQTTPVIPIIKVVFYDNTGYKFRNGAVVSKPATPGYLIVPRANYYNLVSTKTPVMVVHGITSNGITQQIAWMPTFNAAGIKSAYISMEPIGNSNSNAVILKKAIDTLVTLYNVPQVSVISHSKGGPDTEFALYKSKAARRVASVFTFGSPHRGGVAADIGNSTVINLLSQVSPFLANAKSVSNSFNTAAMAYYFANAAMYVAQKKVSATSIVNVNPKTDIYTKWRTFYGNDRSQANIAVKALGVYIATQICGLSGLVSTCNAGLNDGVIENTTSKRAVVSKQGTYGLLKKNGHHLNIFNGTNSSHVLPFLPSTSTLFKVSPNENDEIFYDASVEDVTMENGFQQLEEETSKMNSGSKIIGSMSGKSSFVVEEDNKETILNLFTQNKPMYVEIKNKKTGVVLSTINMSTSETKDDYSFFANGLYTSELSYTNLAKGEYDIDLKEPFFSFVINNGNTLISTVDLGFKDSEGFIFTGKNKIQISFSDISNLDLTKITAVANIRKIADLEGNAIEEEKEVNYSFNLNSSLDGFETIVTKDLETGMYSITVELDGGSEQTQYVGRTFTKTFYVDKKHSPTGLNNFNGNKNQLTIYPNPTQGNVNILFTESLKDYDATVYSISGSIVKKSSNSNFNSSVLELDLSDVDAGLYIIKIKSSEGSDYISKISVTK